MYFNVIEIEFPTKSRFLAREETSCAKSLNTDLINSSSWLSRSNVVEFPIDFNSLCATLIFE